MKNPKNDAPELTGSTKAEEIIFTDTDTLTEEEWEMIDAPEEDEEEAESKDDSDDSETEVKHSPWHPFQPPMPSRHRQYASSLKQTTLHKRERGSSYGSNQSFLRRRYPQRRC